MSFVVTYYSYNKQNKTATKCKKKRKQFSFTVSMHMHNIQYTPCTTALIILFLQYKIFTKEKKNRMKFYLLQNNNLH